MIKRKQTQQVSAGNLRIGGDAPVSIQSMTSVPVEDINATIEQCGRLASGGAELVRIALRNEEAVVSLRKVLSAVSLPLCADIHFNYKIAIAAMRAGVHKVRINPGNIGDVSRVKEVIKAAKDYGVPIRIGVNGGSLDKNKYPEVTAENLVESALDHVRILEDNDFHNIVVSIKSSGIEHTILANRLFSEARDYPVHLGLTEAGYGLSCIVQSSLVIGHLLLLGIGDTIRVSMTGDPVAELAVAKKILESTGCRASQVKLIACPTCGRTDPGIDILTIARDVEQNLVAKFAERLKATGRTLTVAVMGCEVNGPGEASHADIGVAGGRNGQLLLFSKGEKIRKIKDSEVVRAIEEEVEKMLS